MALVNKDAAIYVKDADAPNELLQKAINTVKNEDKLSSLCENIKGHALEGGQLEVVGSISSQYISALLLIGPILKNGLKLKLTGEIASRPYIDLTLWTMREFGASAEWTDVDTIVVKPQPYQERKYLIENDWSASSYWYEMMALNGNIDSEIRLEGLMDGSKQGDSVVKYIFSLLGVKTEFENNQAAAYYKCLGKVW